jgi:hypothetical protein
MDIIVYSILGFLGFVSWLALSWAVGYVVQKLIVDKFFKKEDE